MLREIPNAIVITRFGAREPTTVLVDDGDPPTLLDAVALLRRLVDLGRPSTGNVVTVSCELLEKAIVEPIERALRVDGS